MIAYGIDYVVRNKAGVKTTLVEAKNLASAKKKIGRKNGYKDGRMITITRVNVIGYL